MTPSKMQSYVKRLTLFRPIMWQDACATHHDPRVIRDAQTHHCDGNRGYRCDGRRLVDSHGRRTKTNRQDRAGLGADLATRDHGQARQDPSRRVLGRVLTAAAAAARYVYADAIAWRFGDWQSPAMAVLWRLIDPLAPGSASMFLLTASLYWLAFGTLAFLAGRRSAWLALVAPVVALVPPAFFFVGMVWRDVLFG